MENIHKRVACRCYLESLMASAVNQKQYKRNNYSAHRKHALYFPCYSLSDLAKLRLLLTNIEMMIINRYSMLAFLEVYASALHTFMDRRPQLTHLYKLWQLSLCTPQDAS